MLNRSTKVLVCSLSLALCELLAPAPAAAQQEDPREVEARTLCAAGDVDKGVAVLARIFAETNDYTWVYNQGRCYQQNGRFEQAINRFREYLRRGQNLTPEDVKEVEGYIKEAEAEIAKRPAGGGAPGGTTAPPPPAEVSATATTREPTPGWNTQKKVAVGAWAAGGVSLVLGVVFHLGREQKAKEFVDAQCGTDNLDAGMGCRGLHDDVKSKQLVMAIGYGGAAVLGGAGAVLWWLGTRGSSGESASGRPPRLAWSCGPDVAATGLACAGRF
jgi:tetratricopeptide (TPR) repeat protein